MRPVTVVLGAVVIIASFAAGALWREHQQQRVHPVSSTPATSLSPQASEPEAASVLPGTQAAPASMAAAAADLAASPANQPAPVQAAAATSSGIVQSGMPLSTPSQSASAQMRLYLPTRYPGLQAELGISADQMAQLFDLLARQDQEYARKSDEARSLDDGARGQALAEAKQGHEAEIRSLLGAKASLFEEYQKSRTEHVQVDSLRRTLDAGGQPLRQDQLQSLKQVMIGERQRGRDEE